MADCEHHKVCGRAALEDHDGRCILHSEQPDKDVKAFEEALAEHREENGDDFGYVVFPVGFSFKEATFGHATFEGLADFARATFKGKADFGEVTFEGGAYFGHATFEGLADFARATFEGLATFGQATFKGLADFARATFEDLTFFGWATFEDTAYFVKTIFRRVYLSEGPDSEDETLFGTSPYNSVGYAGDASLKDASMLESPLFDGTTFAGNVHFVQSHLRYIRLDDSEIRGACTIEGTNEKPILARGDGLFKNLHLTDETRLHFKHTDLSQSQFLGTDLKEVDFTAVQWCDEVGPTEWFNRIGLYDEICDLDENQGDENQGKRSWEEIKRLYRQLKKNYQDREDYPRAGDFHIGPKEARRQATKKGSPIWLVLTAYKYLSKYGERALPPLYWLAGVVLSCATGYLLFAAPEASTPIEAMTTWSSWPPALLYSLEVSLYPFESGDFDALLPRALNLFQRIVSPLLIALMALALRQRVKR